MVCCGEKWGIRLSMQGNYEHRVDQKGRVAIPVKFRKEFIDRAVLTPGVDPCIVAYPESDWQTISQNYNYPSFSPSDDRDLSRYIFGNAFTVELDKQGRVALPSNLRQRARISDDAVVVGVNRYMEIWSKEMWEEKNRRLEEAIWNLAERSKDKVKD